MNQHVQVAAELRRRMGSLVYTSSGVLYVLTPETLAQLSEGDQWVGLVSSDDLEGAHRLVEHCGGGVLREPSSGTYAVETVAKWGRVGAQVGTDTAAVWAIAPEQLHHFIEDEGLAGLDWQVWANRWEDLESSWRAHGGAVFHTGGDGGFEVEVEGAVRSLGLTRPYGTPQYREAGWWAITPEDPGINPPPVDKGGLMNAVPGVDPDEGALYNGDGPADMMEAVLDEIDMIYREAWGRGATVAEMDAVWEFIFRGYRKGAKASGWNVWVDKAVELTGVPMKVLLLCLDESRTRDAVRLWREGSERGDFTGFGEHIKACVSLAWDDSSFMMEQLPAKPDSVKLLLARQYRQAFDEERLTEAGKAIEGFSLGMALAITQGFVSTHPFFDLGEIRRFIQIRKKYHGVFTAAAAVLAEYFGDAPRFQAAIPGLRRISIMPPAQVRGALSAGVQAFRSLGRVRVSDLPGYEYQSPPRLVVQSFVAIHRALRLSGLEERGDYYRAFSDLETLLDVFLRSRSTPAPVKTLFRKLKLLGIPRDSADVLHFDADPGAWFDLTSDQRAGIRREVLGLQDELSSLFTRDMDVEERSAEAKRLMGALSQIQARAGIHLAHLMEEDQPPLDKVLRSEAQVNRDGPTEYVLDSFKKDLLSSWEESPSFRPKLLSKRELGKLFTTLDKVKTFSTMERVIKTAVRRGLLHKTALETLTSKLDKARRNKALRDNPVLAPLQWEPMTEQEFVAAHDAGGVDFRGDAWTEEQKAEVLGRASRAIVDLEGVFGKGFCGRHARKLMFRFHEGSGTGSGALAHYFGWEDRNRWQPRVSFGEDFDGLLAHELSHYFEDLLAFRIEKATNPDMPEYQYGDVAHGWGDLFGRTGTSLRQFVERSGNSTMGKALQEHFPEFLELMATVVSTPDYARWEDKIGGALSDALYEAITEVTGQSPYAEGNEQARGWMDAQYQSDLPPEVLEAAKRRAIRLRDGDPRKLTYYHSSPECWARLCEQYVYTKLARQGIANPWLTQLTYDVDVLDQFVEEATFEERIEPLMDAVFNKLRDRSIIARVVRREQELSRIVDRKLILLKTGTYERLLRCGAAEGDGSRVGVFIPLPANLAQQFPSLKEDSSPVHVTFLYAGKVWEEGLFMEILRRRLGELEAPVQARLDGQDFFRNADGYIPHVRVRFDQDLARVRKLVIDDLREAGWTLADRSQMVWRPHVTLGYQKPHSEHYQGEVPTGGWEFDRLEVWGLERKKVLLLGKKA